MPKQCNKPTCTYNQFGGGYCRNHQYLRTDKKPKPLKKTSIKKVSLKRKVSLKKDTEQLHRDWLFYLEIWNEREHVCFETGEPLGDEPLTLFFHHVLEKGIEKYAPYRHCKWNIVLITWQTHDQVGMDIDKCPKIKAYRDLLLKRIEKWKTKATNRAVIGP
jgi:hypothetical protein